MAVKNPFKWQPQSAAAANFASPLLRGCKQLFNGKFPENVGPGANVVVLGAISPTPSPAGIGPWFNGNGAFNYWTLSVPAAEVNARNDWTYSCVVSFVDKTQLAIVSMAQAINSGTYDRTLSITAGGVFTGMIFDGGTKIVTGTTVVTNNTKYVVTLTCTSSALSLYVNGVLEGTTSVANSGYNGYSADPLLEFGRGSVANANGDASFILPLFVRCDGHAWSASEALSFAINPWQVFDAPPRTEIFSSAGSSNVTVGITGVVGTGAAGNTGVQHDQPITGNAATGAVGTVGVNTGSTVTGVVGTGAAGNVTPSTTVALTGVVGTGAAGNVSGSSGGDLTLAITGVSATGQVGNVGITKDGSVALTGAAATGTAGSVGVQHDQAVTGVAATTAVGSVTPSLTVSLTGVVGTGAVGTVGASSGGDKTVAITGVSATGYAGILTPSGGDAGVTGGGHGRYNLGHKKGVGDDIEEYLELLKERARKKAEERLERERRKAEEIEEARERLAAVRKEGQTAASRKEAARIVANLRKLEAQEQKAKEEGTRRRQQEADDQDFMDALVFLDNLGE